MLNGLKNITSPCEYDNLSSRFQPITPNRNNIIEKVYR